MTAGEKLSKALTSIDWSANVASFCKDTVLMDRMAAINLRLAIWSKQFENTDGTNPAICFIREMQVSGHLVATSTALASYKSSAAAMRTIVESALYYTYFRTHLTELATLLRDEKWYLSKQDILDYHMVHTYGFSDLQKKLSLASILNPWYSKISSIIHGQIPGAWLVQKSISDIKPNSELTENVLLEFEECVRIVDRLFFSTVVKEFWDYFSPSAKKALTHGMTGESKTAFAVDTA